MIVPQQKVKETMWKALRHYATGDDMKCLRLLIPAGSVPSVTQVEAYLRELTESPELLASVSSDDGRRFQGVAPSMTAEQMLGMRLAMHATGKGRAILLYVTARVMRPRVVIETGCFSGWDSAMLLQALRMNGEGHLWSIDLPAKVGQFSQTGSYAGLPEGMGTGFLVPESYKDRWTLIEANVRDALLPLLADVSEVDLFLHDSEHTYAHMMWEYATVLPHMSRDGIIVSDDIAWNTSFWDFASAVGRPFVIHRSNANVGALAMGLRRAA